ncbi:hypothetical protein D5086_000958 [Populus alba]|uniref:Uncharacterized protein n=1 Tax=Populus alba TaxID=43335 RepID=A0ACC4CXC1_POPAL
MAGRILQEDMRSNQPLKSEVSRAHVPCITCISSKYTIIQHNTEETKQTSFLKTSFLTCSTYKSKSGATKSRTYFKLWKSLFTTGQILSSSNQSPCSGESIHLVSMRRRFGTPTTSFDASTTIIAS